MKPKIQYIIRILFGFLILGAILYAFRDAISNSIDVEKGKREFFLDYHNSRKQ